MRGPKRSRNFLGSSLKGWPAVGDDAEAGRVAGDRRTPSGSVRRGDGPGLGKAAQSPLNALVSLLRS